ncbi:hypothetical protein KKD37_01665 [Patescibacteria group bacterium]|nr:hypothetical protein [Patescibacteria group bacterium]
MKEKNITTPFKYGVSLRYTCWAGLRGEITLRIPKSAENKEKKLWIATAQDACKTCEMDRFYCSKIDQNGVAQFDGFSQTVKRLIKARKTPCAKKVKVVK